MSDKRAEECKTIDDDQEEAKSGGLAHIRALIEKTRFLLSRKSQDAHADGLFEIRDIAACISTGYVHKVERDQLKDCVGNKKYVIIGLDTNGYMFYTVGKIIRTDSGYAYLIITARPAEANYV